MRNRFATDLNSGGYIVIEVAVYPASGREVGPEEASRQAFTRVLTTGIPDGRPCPAISRAIEEAPGRRGTQEHVATKR